MIAGRPLIGITPNARTAPGITGYRTPYFESVSRSGGVPLFIPFEEDAVLDAFLERIDGLLVPGGDDIDPHLYGEELIPECGELYPERDALERRLLKKAWERGMPVLGICRGFQIANVVLGGTLWQDLAAQTGRDPSLHRQTEPYETPTHAVTVYEGTRLAEMSGAGELLVNSFHHQAVKVLSPVLRETARSSDGLVEAFEAPSRRFFVGVQWHPEMLSARDPRAQALFNGLARAAREYAAKN